MYLYGVIGYHVTLSEGHMIANHPIYGVIGYHVTLSEGHMIAYHPHIWLYHVHFRKFLSYIHLMLRRVINLVICSLVSCLVEAQIWPPH